MDRRPGRFYRKLVRWLIGRRAPDAEREMVAVFDDAYEDAAHRGPWRRLLFLVTSFLDLLITSAALFPRRRRAAFAAGLLADVKVVFRGLGSRSSFGAFVVASLALGIGANTAIFSVLNAALLRPLPLANADRVLAPIAMRGEDPFQVTAFDYLEWKSRARSFDAFGLSSATSFTLDVDGEPERIEAARITPGYFATLGSSPILGRRFVEDDACCRESPVALLSHGLWQRAFGGRREALGESVLLDGVRHSVVGVMPPGVDVPFDTELWVPLALDALDQSERHAFDYFAVLRLADGANVEEGRAELRAIAARLESAFPDTHAGLSVEAIPLRQHLLVDFEGRVEPSLVALLASVGLLLLTACANVSNLFLARSLQRSHELALRASLGASRFRLVRHVLVEALVLASLGGVAALVLARFTIPLLSGISPIEPLALAARLDAIEIDGTVVVFTLAVTLFSGLALGLVSACQISRGDLSGSLRQARAGLNGRRVMNKLVIVQVAAAVSLAVGAGLTISSLHGLRSLSLGFQPEGLLAARIQFPPRDDPDHAGRQILVGEILSRVRSIPGVAAAGVTTNLPADHLSWDAVYTPRGGAPFDPKNVPLTADRLVSPGYLESLGVKLVFGRLISVSDRADAEPIVVITRDFAERAWPGQDPLGKQVKRGTPDAGTPWMTVVGVVEPVKEDRAAFRRDRPAWYVPFAQVATTRNPTLLVRAGAGASTLRLRSPIREAVREVAPTSPVYGFVDLEAHLDDLFARDRFGVALLSVFSGLGLLLAAVGIYGVLASAVESRRSEIGLRVALGADPGRLVRRFAMEGMALGGKGTLLGLLAALVMGRLVSSLLFEVHPADPRALAVAAALGVAVSIAASYGPARRVTSVDAARAIRGE